MSNCPFRNVLGPAIFLHQVWPKPSSNKTKVGPIHLEDCSLVT